MRVTLSRILVLVSVSLVSGVFVAKKSFGGDFGTGIVAVEDGDDRFRPAAVLHFAANNGFISRAYAYGRNYGPVQERNFLLSMGKRFDLSGKSWQGNVGVALLSDTTSIKYSDHPEENQTFTSTNVGMAFGLHWNFFETKTFLMRATWDSHVFPAGAAFIYLANARKSTLGLTASVAF